MSAPRVSETIRLAGSGLLTCLVLAVVPATALGEELAAPLEEIVILGRGETRQLQAITAQQIDYLPAGTSPLKAIEKLPGVNFQSADPYGNYEWSTRIALRLRDVTGAERFTRVVDAAALTVA